MGRISTPALPSGTMNVVRPLCLGTRCCAGQHEDVGGPVGGAGEHLLPVDQPILAVALGARLGRGHVRAASRLGVASTIRISPRSAPPTISRFCSSVAVCSNVLLIILVVAPAVQVEARGVDLLETARRPCPGRCPCRRTRTASRRPASPARRAARALRGLVAAGIRVCARPLAGRRVRPPSHGLPWRYSASLSTSLKSTATPRLPARSSAAGVRPDRPSRSYSRRESPRASGQALARREGTAGCRTRA